MAEYLGDREGEKPVGVYALYDARRELQYVGVSRNMVLAIKVLDCVRCSFADTGHLHHICISCTCSSMLACIADERPAALRTFEPHTTSSSAHSRPCCERTNSISSRKHQCSTQLQGHLERVGEERAAYVRAMVFANRAMSSRSNLEREAANWIDEAGTTPPGNGGQLL